VGLDGFETQTSQTSSHFFPIPSNPCVLGITEQALKKFWKVYLKILVTATAMMRIVVVKTPKIDLGDQVMRFSANQVLKKIILST
jgi:protein-arginine kinase